MMMIRPAWVFFFYKLEAASVALVLVLAILVFFSLPIDIILNSAIPPLSPLDEM